MVFYVEILILLSLFSYRPLVSLPNTWLEMTAKPAGSIIPSPVQNNASVNVACINPGINNANEISAVSMVAILTVSPITVTSAALF